MKRAIITGAAGFIGMHTAEKLLKLGHIVHGIDNLNNYYSISLKKYRLSILKEYENFKFYKIDISAKDQLDQLFHQHDYNYVIHLAAQAGVRHSINKPFEYIDSNINITNNIKHYYLLYAKYTIYYSFYLNRISIFTKIYNVYFA